MIVELAQLTLTLTKAELLTVISVIMSWSELKPLPHKLHEWTLIDAVRGQSGVCSTIKLIQLCVQQ